MIEPEDDINHLLLNCSMNSELAAGLRYAYYRLDTIDRKGSEMGRSVTVVLTILLALLSFQRDQLIKADPSQLIVLIAFIGGLILLTIWILVIVVGINRLEFYRISRHLMDAKARIPNGEKVQLCEGQSFTRPILHYLQSMSEVTVAREQQLHRLRFLYFAWLALALICFLIAVIITFPHLKS